MAACRAGNRTVLTVLCVASDVPAAPSRKTVETVLISGAGVITPLKRGVNEMAARVMGAKKAAAGDKKQSRVVKNYSPIIQYSEEFELRFSGKGGFLRPTA